MPLSIAKSEPWRSCYEQLAPKLLLFARQWVCSAADAEDVVQSAFVRFWQRQPDAKPEHYPLLYAAVRSAALDLIRSDERRARREQAAFEDPLVETTCFDPATAEQREDAAALEHGLNRLPAEQREVVVLRVWGELTFAEIATVLGASLNTVSARYRYGLENLRRLLQPHAHERV